MEGSNIRARARRRGRGQGRRKASSYHIERASSHGQFPLSRDPKSFCKESERNNSDATTENNATFGSRSSLTSERGEYSSWSAEMLLAGSSTF